MTFIQAEGIWTVQGGEQHCYYYYYYDYCSRM